MIKLTSCNFRMLLVGANGRDCTHCLLVQLQTLDVEWVGSVLLGNDQAVSDDDIVEENIVTHGPQFKTNGTLLQKFRHLITTRQRSVFNLQSEPSGMAAGPQRSQGWECGVGTTCPCSWGCRSGVDATCPCSQGSRSMGAPNRRNRGRSRTAGWESKVLPTHHPCQHPWVNQIYAILIKFATWKIRTAGKNFTKNGIEAKINIYNLRTARKMNNHTQATHMGVLLIFLL